jgi:hypothetical protein
MTGCAGTIRKPAPRAPDTPPRAGAAPRPRPRSTALGLGDAPGGRGLLIVAALAASHGTRPAPGGGKHVWARLTPHPPRPPPPARPPVPASTPTTRPEKREHTP